MMNFAQFKGAVTEALDTVDDLNPNANMDLDDWLFQLQIALENAEGEDDEVEDED